MSDLISRLNAEIDSYQHRENPRLRALLKQARDELDRAQAAPAGMDEAVEAAYSAISHYPMPIVCDDDSPLMLADVLANAMGHKDITDAGALIGELAYAATTAALPHLFPELRRDADALDWLERKCVQVRQMRRYGEGPILINAKPDLEDETSDLRAQIRAAMAETEGRC